MTDYSGRTFQGITAFQYALWALDRHMWTMILKYLPRDEAKKQLHDHVYSEKKYKALHGSHYDFVPLIDALQAYVDNYAGWSDDQKIEHWCKKVGSAQRLVAVHVANEYCRGDRSFYPVPKFDEENLPRSLYFHTYGGNKQLWFPLPLDKGTGVDFGMWRAHFSSANAVDNNFPLWLMPRSFLIRPDLAALTALCKVRTNEFLQLKKQLLNDDLTEEQILNSKSSTRGIS